MPNTETLAVEIDATTVLIYASRKAGVCGPAQSTARPATLADVDAWLTTHQLERTGDYAMTEAYDGLRLSAPVARQPKRPGDGASDRG